MRFTPSLVRGSLFSLFLSFLAAAAAAGWLVGWLAMLNKVTSEAAGKSFERERAGPVYGRGEHGRMEVGGWTQETGSDLHRTLDKSDDSVKRESTV